MRKIDIESSKFFWSQNTTDFKRFQSNTEVVVYEHYTGNFISCNFYLHNNKIARLRYENGVLKTLIVKTCGWNTRTTASRLNAIFKNSPLPFLNSYRVRIKGGVMHLNDEPLEGEVTINLQTIINKRRMFNENN